MSEFLTCNTAAEGTPVSTSSPGNLQTVHERERGGCGAASFQVPLLVCLVSQRVGCSPLPDLAFSHSWYSAVCVCLLLSWAVHGFIRAGPYLKRYGPLLGSISHIVPFLVWSTG